MSTEQQTEYEIAMKELSTYCTNFSRKYGPMRDYPQKTQFDPIIHFQPVAIHSLDIDTSLIQE